VNVNSTAKDEQEALFSSILFY